MKITKLLLAGTAFTLACGFLPIKTDIKEDHFRFENFKRDKGSNNEYVHLMCFAKKPTAWAQPKQYKAGEHKLWVKANISKDGVPSSSKHAFAEFDVDLEAGKSYMLNRSIENDKISMWIQEVETGIGVSEVIVADLNMPLNEERKLRLDQCRQGTI